MKMRDEDKRLVLRIKSGDEIALSSFIDKHRGWVFKRAMEHLRNFEDAEEATMDIFQCLWVNAKKIETKNLSFWAFFNLIVKSRIIDFYRKRKRREDNMDRDLLQEDERALEKVFATKDPLSDRLERDEIYDVIVEVLEQVSSPPQHRLAWILKNFEGYKIKEICDIMKMKEGTVKIGIYRCKEKMRKILEQEDYNEYTEFIKDRI